MPKKSRNNKKQNETSLVHHPHKNDIVELQTKYSGEIKYLNYICQSLNIVFSAICTGSLHWLLPKFLLREDQPLLMPLIFPEQTAGVPTEEIMLYEYRLWTLLLGLFIPKILLPTTILLNYLFPVGFSKQILKSLVGIDEVPKDQGCDLHLCDLLTPDVKYKNTYVFEEKTSKFFYVENNGMVMQINIDNINKFKISLKEIMQSDQYKHLTHEQADTLITSRILDLKIKTLEKLNNHLFNIINSFAMGGKVAFPILLLCTMQTAMSRESSNSELIFSYAIRNLLAVLFGLTVMANKLQYNQGLLIEENEKLLANLQNVTTCINSSWICPKKDQHNAYFKLTLSKKKVSNFKDLSNNKHPLPTKVIIEGISNVLQNLKIKILARTGNTILVESIFDQMDSIAEDKINSARDSLIKRLTKHKEIQQFKPLKLAQLNKMAEAVGFSGWWYTEIESDNLPEIQFGLFCIDKTISKQLEIRFKILGYQFEIQPDQILVTGYNCADEHLLNDCLKQLEDLKNQFSKKIIEEIAEITADQELDTNEQVKDSLESVKIKTKGEGRMRKWFSGYSFFAQQEAPPDPCNIKWSDEKFNKEYRDHPENFVQLENFGGGRFFAFFNPKLYKKLGDRASGFHRVFCLGIFIGQGYAPNRQGHVLENGIFVLKKVGDSGDTRVWGEVAACGPNGERIVNYQKIGHH
jgi:hypothetical protein